MFLSKTRGEGSGGANFLCLRAGGDVVGRVAGDGGRTRSTAFRIVSCHTSDGKRAISPVVALTLLLIATYCVQVVPSVELDPLSQLEQIFPGDTPPAEYFPPMQGSGTPLTISNPGKL